MKIGLHELTNVTYYNNGIHNDLIRVNTDDDVNNTYYLRYKQHCWEKRNLKPFPSPNWSIKTVKDTQTLAKLEEYIADFLDILP